MGRRIIDNGIKYQANSKDFLEALISNAHYCGLLRNSEKKASYEKLLDWILSYKPILTDTEKKLPDLKEIYKMAGIPYSHIGTDLRDIYFAIFKLNIDDPRKFMEEDENFCHLSINYFGQRARFRLGLTVMPRAGEKFTFHLSNPF